MARRTIRALSMMALLALGITHIGGALAQTPLERGNYLVNGILACGNCHTPKGEQGAPILERELSGGLSFTTPAFNATASNITPDRETGIGAWSNEAIKGHNAWYPPGQCAASCASRGGHGRKLFQSSFAKRP